MSITKEQFDAVQAANPGVEIEILQHDRLPDEVIARVPAPAAWNIYRNLQSEGKKNEAVQALVAQCVLFPPKEDLQKSLDAHPGLAEVWAGELVEMAGISSGARRKKY
jgi:hypothetical protein